MRIKAADYEEPNEGKKIPVFLVINDLNTLSEHVNRKFSKDEIQRYFQSITIELQGILNLYFQDNGENR
jgi:hypothetical protein